MHSTNQPGQAQANASSGSADKPGNRSLSTGSPNIQNEVTEEFISERRLWTAVLVKAIDDWRNGPLRARREAQKFLFDDTRDFPEVCAGAGIDPTSFRMKLLTIGQRISMTNPWIGSLRFSGRTIPGRDPSLQIL